MNIMINLTIILTIQRKNKRFTKAYDVATGVTFNLEPQLAVEGKYLLVMELRR
jgi:hypothetical protein